MIIKTKKQNILLKKTLFCCFLLINITVALGQDIGQIGKAKLFKLTGGVAANSVYYNGISNREPFTYILSGNINLNISNVYNIPVSFTYSNQKFESSNPFSFNRLSIHPSYKWITTHIGDVSMNFSPYTLNGHQFSGLGVDLTPKSKWNISTMYGRLLKASEYDENNATTSEPAYKRIGYGLKAKYDFDKFSLATIFFKATDDKNSIENPVPVEFELQPKDNIVMSVESNVKFLDHGEIKAEIALSTITEDTNAEGKEVNPNLFSSLLKTNITTNKYKAYNLGFTYAVGKGTIGVEYEHIDPEYRTLGAYFFNNDLENITINATQNILDNKVAISFNGGLQKDDLNNEKSSQLTRVVSAVNVTYTASEKLNVSGAYSNFQSYTNIKNQFDYINELTQTDNLDTLDFQQISKNASLNINYILKNSKTKKENIAMALSFQNAVNKQGGNTVENGDSKFYNGNASYNINYPNNDLNISSSLNISYSNIGTESSITFGPILSANKLFFEKQLRTNGSISYNQSKNNGKTQSQVTNIRMGSSYSYKKKHNFSLNLLSQFRGGTTSDQSFTATFGYNYIFDKFKLKLPEHRRKEKELKKKEKTKKGKRTKKSKRMNFRYRDSLYTGTIPEVHLQLNHLQNHSNFDYIPSYKKADLATFLKTISNEKDTNKYKIKAIQFLKKLYSYEDFLAGYQQLIYETIKELQKDMNRLDYAFEKAFTTAQYNAKNHAFNKVTTEQLQKASEESQQEYQRILEKPNVSLARLISHRWMLTYVTKYRTLKDVKNPDIYLAKVIEAEKENIFKMWDRNENKQKIQLYIITKIIDFYIKESVNHTDPNEFELKYIIKE